MTFETNVSDAEMNAAFANANFGDADHRELLANSVFKRLVGYRCGHTITVIMRELELTTRKDNVTVKGKKFVGHHFYKQLSTGG